MCVCVCVYVCMYVGMCESMISNKGIVIVNSPFEAKFLGTLIHRRLNRNRINKQTVKILRIRQADG